MAMEPAAELQAWVDRLNAGDKSARDELIRHAGARLRGLVGKMMQKYDRLERWVDIDDVLQNAVVRLLRAMDSTPVSSVQEFFSLAALQIRRELIDLCRHYFGPQGEAANHERAGRRGAGGRLAATRRAGRARRSRSARAGVLERFSPVD